MRSTRLILIAGLAAALLGCGTMNNAPANEQPDSNPTATSTGLASGEG